MTEKKIHTDPAKDDWEMLGHDPVPGYKTAFYVAVLVSVIYLAAAFFSGGGGH
ncbi:MAG TPA: hypothetical protein VK885_02610 [Desulfotignum sp.]|jgi:hypothetical protein|nr:hypothetical protein [Desulfotignum sp.]